MSDEPGSGEVKLTEDGLVETNYDEGAYLSCANRQSLGSKFSDCACTPPVIESFDDMGLKEDLLRGIYSYGFEVRSDK